MEKYRLSSRLRENETEYFIQTVNETERATITTSIYINGVLTESADCPHPDQVNEDEILSLVKITHGEKKKEIENLLKAFKKLDDCADSRMLYNLGTAFFHKGFFREASVLFRRATMLDPGQHQSLNYLGIAELAQGNIEDAIQAASKAVEKKPGYADYHNNLGECYLANDNYEEAIDEFEQAIKINLYYSEAYFNLALAYILKTARQPDKEQWPALLTRISDYFYKATMIRPEMKTAAYEEGVNALNSGDLTRALTVFKSIQDGKKESTRKEFSNFFMKYALLAETVTDKNLQDRIAYLTSELEKNPSYVDMIMELGQCYLELSRLNWQKGVEQFRKALEVNPAIGHLRLTVEAAENLSEDIAITLRRIKEKG